ncbi:MAG: hypothetical protein HY744_05305 [Deltaproteobacteria bacterium]|nr:hypothetical protein [Deltaproteobacteria bacterium]
MLWRVILTNCPIEVKASARVHDGDLRALRALAEEHRVRHRIVACLEREPRAVGGIQVLPWRMLLERLYAGEIVR